MQKVIRFVMVIFNVIQNNHNSLRRGMLNGLTKTVTLFAINKVSQLRHSKQTCSIFFESSFIISVKNASTSPFVLIIEVANRIFMQITTSFHVIKRNIVSLGLILIVFKNSSPVENLIYMHTPSIGLLERLETDSFFGSRYKTE